MERNFSLHDLSISISDTTYDSDSTESNSLVEGYAGDSACDQLDSRINQPQTNINALAVTSSSNVQVGDRVIYNGPVTIKQEFCSDGSELKDISGAPEVKNILKSHLKWNLFIVLSLLLLMFALFLASTKISTKTAPSTTKKPFEFKLHSRSDWEAAKPNGSVDPFNLPLSRVIILRTCDEVLPIKRIELLQNCCFQNMKQMESLHMGRNYSHIGYNFVICNNGDVYEGIGWDYEGVHTRGHNRINYGIAFNGNFNLELPNTNQVTAFFTLLKLGVELGKLTPDYKIFGARQFIQTDSPGEALYQMIQTWDHWSEAI
ncbi:peptidoglycan-recognition protein SD-like [Chironomus tepperi]|uniref:peptidoglycan-recognition protein SD-like n=1 Tax=Chironomus tepperi TaxID=113505 RepID=UPI00391F630C